MKHFVLLAVLLLMILGACQKEDMSSTMDEMSSSINDSVSGSSDTLHLKAGTLTGYDVSPRFGRPNSTYYSFKVYDPVGTLSLSVKLYDRVTGSSTYLPMTKTGSYWLLSMKISNSGCYAYNYVYSISKNPINSSVSYADLWNSKNTFNASGISSISWPFGADGSSWSIRNNWNGGQEGGSGYGWDEYPHTGTTERYSDDWNRGTGSQDLGAIIRSPLDGYIETVGQYYVSGYGYSKYVSVIQQGPDGKMYRFYVGHLQTTASGLYSGKYVRAGIDQIGTLGSTGASSPHAHTNMRVNGASVKFYFNAQ